MEAANITQFPGTSNQQPKAEKSYEQDECAAVKRWLARYDRAKTKWSDDFTRMRENMEFVAGLQWDEQTKMRDDKGRYVVNMTIRVVSRKVSQLYAKNPDVEAKARKRLMFALWDGEVDTLTQCMQRLQQSMMTGIPDMEAMAILQDFKQGRQEEQLIQKICKTLEIVDTYDTDNSNPDFKGQMKQLVRRVVTCGVGYARPVFVRAGTTTNPPLTIDAKHSTPQRIQQMASIASEVNSGETSDMDANYNAAKSLSLSLTGVSGDEDSQMSERIEHDFLPATSVIPDENCRSLKDFVAARWIFIEYNIPACDINDMFGLEGEDRVKPDKQTDSDKEEEKKNIEDVSQPEDEAFSAKATLVEVIDATTKTRCYVNPGREGYVSPPENFDPDYPGFWPVAALTFNDVEIDDTCTRATIYPPSDVDLVIDPQREWNRSREALRDQRNANAPSYLVKKGMLSPKDIENIRNRTPNQVIELENCPNDVQPNQLVQVLQVAAIDPAVYETRSLEQDLMLAGGVQQANIGPAQADVTATVGTIAEQSRTTEAAEDVDDLDEFLTKLARMRGHLRLQAMSEEVVKEIVGPGAVWPGLNKSQYLKLIVLSIKAGSSGRPNKALAIANFERIAPTMLQAGANPIRIIEEAVKRLDDDIDITEFYPLPGMPLANPSPMSAPPGQQGVPGPQQPLQPLPSGNAMPLAAG